MFTLTQLMFLAMKSNVRFITYLLSTILIVNSMLIGLANAAKFVAINNSLPQDVLVICTGNSIKYISEAALFENGKIVEVKFASENSAQNYPIDTCPIKTGLEKSKYLHNTDVAQRLTILRFLLRFVALRQAPHFSFAFILLPARAPPSLV
jgi:hypothetical protein